MAKNLVYIAARLFSSIDRLAAAQLAYHVDRRIEVGPSWTGEGAKAFLPFRDTDQQSMKSENKARALYEADINALESSTALIALYEGISKDSGVSMEIGYAFGRGLPVGVISTDFIHETNINDQCEPFDPIIYSMASKAENFAQSFAGSGDYASRHDLEFQASLKDFADTFLAEKVSAGTATKSTGVAEVYCDIFAARYEWTRDLQIEIQSRLAAKNIRTALPQRSISRHAAADDIQALVSASVAVFSLDATELDPGGAALIGLAAASGVPVILISTSHVRALSRDGQSMLVNLMIEQSATNIVGSISDCIKDVVRIISHDE